MSDTTNTGATTTEAGEQTVDTNTATDQQQDTQQTTQAGEQKPAAGTEQAEAKASETPAIEVTLPEGFVPNEGLLATLKEAAKDSASAQKLADAYFALQQQATETIEQERAGWRKEIEADKGIDLAGVKRAMERYGSPKLQEALDASGYGDHPELVRFFDRIGKATKDDSIAGTTGGGGGDVNPEEARLRRAYPTHFKE